MASRLSDTDLRAVFNMFDADNSGKISCSELGEAMKQLNGVEMSQHEIDRMMELSDINGDGEISFKEFKKLMRKQAGEEEEVAK